MASELISRRLRNLFTDHLAGASTLREITDEFDAEGIEYEKPKVYDGGQRRTLIAGYYNTLDFNNARDVRKFLNVLAVFMRGMERWANTTGESDTLDALTDQLRRDGYAYINGTISPITAAARLADAKAIAAEFDASHIAEQIQRIEASVDSDPPLAIGTAKELTESCFKTILKERNVEYQKGDNLLELGKRVFKELKLLPDDIPENAKGSATIKRVLMNLSTVVQGIAELRGLYGTGHGKEGNHRGLNARHARLVVGAASTLVTFVFQTHTETKATVGKASEA